MPQRGKRGRGLTYPAAVRKQLDYIKEQIPVYLRGLGLEHPGMEFWFDLPADNSAIKAWSSDWDGMVTAVQDILVYFGVLADDSFKHCNGRKIINEATRADSLVQTTRVMLRPR